MALQLHHRASPAVVVTLIAALAALPAITHAIDEPFYLVLASRILLYALAATSLNLLVGFGHAAFFGTGAYVVAIAASHGLDSAWTAWPLAMGVAAFAALVIGAISLRTRGVYFIMITLAFAQMFFFLGVSLKQYGGDDGMRLTQRSVLAPLDLAGASQLYYLILALLLLLLYLSWRLLHARFGHVLRGIKANERRMRALGFDATRLKLVIYVIAACVASLAGFLLANLTGYASPSYTAWTVSGELIVMVILGGAGTVIGPLVGALVLLLLEEWLASLTTHWMAPLGLSILLVVLLTRRGLYGAFLAWSRRHAP